MLIRAYLIEGLDVRELALRHEMSEAHVRAALGAEGVRVGPGQIRDAVCAAVAAAGYESFAAYAQARGLEPIGDQARELGVSQHGVERIHTVFRELAGEPGLSDRGASADQEAQARG